MPASGAKAISGRAGPAATRRGPALRILGIDPGLASMGWGVVEAREGRLHHLGHGCLVTSKDEALGDRLFTISSGIEELIANWKPGLAGMESLFFWKNVSSALPVAEARGVIRLAFVRAGIDLADFSPTAIKQAVVGSSRADKEQVQAMVKLLLGLPDLPKPDHAADALAAAICRWHHEGPLADPRR
ncbi:MAG: crossover junction endodeoxyribonuclease RuvC [Spirochaetota bacterium]